MAQQKHYDAPEEFRGFRYYTDHPNTDGDEKDEHVQSKRKLAIMPDTEYIAFGIGKHTWCVFACTSPSHIDLLCIHSPGRFFASGALKAILAHLVLNYDIKLVEEGKRPANFFFFMAVMPNAYGKVMLRKRQHDVKA